MQCPKCEAEQAATNAVCAGCGLVFEKYYKYHPRPGEEAEGQAVVIHRSRPLAGRGSPTRSGSGAGAAAPGRAPPPWMELLLPAGRKVDWVAFTGRSLLFLVLFVWGGRLILSSVESNAAGESFLHLINLPFHEAGHVIFSPFGPFIQSLGGTLGQLMMPAICCGVLLVQTRDPFGAAVAFWWFGENFLDIAPYIADARAGVLPLVGGNIGRHAPYGFHDWEYLLTETGLLHLDRAIAQASHLFGAVLMLLALAWAGLLLYRDYLALASRR